MKLDRRTRPLCPAITKGANYGIEEVITNGRVTTRPVWRLFNRYAFEMICARSNGVKGY
ncbi:MAG: hypothetical protein HOD27_08820 [Betaproteobacteria bacterium]|nr:hypothetical protein [Betaproteobacteria bacterium]MDC1433559.1 hypothetical protein [Burkholderiales bacterium]